MAVSACRAALCEGKPQNRAQLAGLCQEIFDAWGVEAELVPLSLTEAESRMPSGAFARCHKSDLVSLAWVEEFSRAEVLLRDGTRLPVSRTFYAPFQSALSRRAWRPQRRPAASSVFSRFGARAGAGRLLFRPAAGIMALR